MPTFPACIPYGRHTNFVSPQRPLLLWTAEAI